MQGNSGESQGKLKKSFLSLEKCRETQGKLKKSILKPRKVQGNSGGKLRGNSGETQKIIFKAYKSAGKLRGNSKNPC